MNKLCFQLGQRSVLVILDLREVRQTRVGGLQSFLPRRNLLPERSDLILVRGAVLVFAFWG